MDTKEYFCSSKLIQFIKFYHHVFNEHREALDIIEDLYKYTKEIELFEQLIHDEEAMDYYSETGYPPEKYYDLAYRLFP